MDIYILYNKEENRPMIKTNDFGSLVCFLTKEQAQAYKRDLGNKDCQIRVRFLDKPFNVID